MTMFSMHHSALAVNALVPQTITTSAINSGDEDLQDYNGALIVVSPGSIDGLGAGSPTGGTIAVKIEHADESTVTPDTAGTYANVAQVDVVGNSITVSAGVVHTFDENNTGIFQVGYVGDKRYIKVTLTPTGLGSGGPVVVTLIKHHGRHQSVHDTQV